MASYLAYMGVNLTAANRRTIGGNALTARRPAQGLLPRMTEIAAVVHLWLRDEPLPRAATGKIQKRALKAAYT